MVQKVRIEIKAIWDQLETILRVGNLNKLKKKKQNKTHSNTLRGPPRRDPGLPPWSQPWPLTGHSLCTSQSAFLGQSKLPPARGLWMQHLCCLVCSRISAWFCPFLNKRLSLTTLLVNIHICLVCHTRALHGALENLKLQSGFHIFSGGSVVKRIVCQCRRRGFDPWVGKIPWSRKW